MGRTGLLRIAIAASFVVSAASYGSEATGIVVAVTEGRLVFDNTPIGEAVEVFNRYNAMKLHIADVGLAQKRISGVFEATRPESFVAFIQSVVKVRVSHDGLVTTLSSL
jgi:ferric-dicitrate binding protein FerR (iron transport regulator)